MVLSQLHIHAFRFINDLGKDYTFLNPVFIFFAEYMTYILVFGIIVYWLRRTETNRIMVLQGFFSFLFAEILGKIAGQFYSHYQPFATLPDVNKLIFHEVDNSFPSDHMILFVSFCFSFWLVRRKKSWLWLLIALFVGISRIAVGVHHPIDILIGAILGIFSSLLMYFTIPKATFIKTFLHRYEKMEQSVLSFKKSN